MTQYIKINILEEKKLKKKKKEKGIYSNQGKPSHCSVHVLGELTNPPITCISFTHECKYIHFELFDLDCNPDNFDLEQHEQVVTSSL